jgi:transcriptional regulator with XRE-family HTH domain
MQLDLLTPDTYEVYFDTYKVYKARACDKQRFFVMDLNPTDLGVGARIRSRRIALGVSPEKLALELGVSSQEIIAWEAGMTRIGASWLSKSQKLSMSARCISSRILIRGGCTEIHRAGEDWRADRSDRARRQSARAVYPNGIDIDGSPPGGRADRLLEFAPFTAPSVG